MNQCRYKPGDRVISMQYLGNHYGIAGTVIQLEKGAKGRWVLHVILDTAEDHWAPENAWILVNEWDDQVYIPF